MLLCKRLLAMQIQKLSFPVMVTLLCCFSICKAAYSEDLQDLTEHLRYLAAKDTVISKNIANADTPEYLPKDLEEQEPQKDSKVLLERTHQAHFQIDSVQTDFNLVQDEVLELKPNGNGVVIEHELMKKNENSLRFSETSNLYNKIRNMIKVSTVGLK
ncbi:flagellar basal-body rod protein FlgB [Alphaproteobacteria bacterium]